MNIDKGLIKHWAMLFESEDVRENGEEKIIKCEVSNLHEDNSIGADGHEELVENRNGGFEVILANYKTGKIARKLVRKNTEDEAREYAEKNLVNDDFPELVKVIPLDDLNMNVFEFKKDCVRAYDKLYPLQEKLLKYFEMLEVLGKKIPSDLEAYMRFFEMADEVFMGGKKEWHGTYAGGIYGMDGVFGKRKED